MNKQTQYRLILIATTAPLMLAGCQSANTSTTPSEPNSHYIAMADTVAQLRETPCEMPATSAEKTRLAQYDPMVIVSGALHTWVPSHEFPIYLRAMKETFHCDSEQWVANFQKHLAYSNEFSQALVK